MRMLRQKCCFISEWVHFSWMSWLLTEQLCSFQMIWRKNVISVALDLFIFTHRQHWRILFWIHGPLTVLRDAAVPCRCGGDDHGGGGGVGAKRLRLLRRYWLESGEGCEGIRDTRGSGGQQGGGVCLWYSPWGRWEVFSNSRSGVRRKSSKSWGCGCHVVSWCCCDESTAGSFRSSDWINYLTFRELCLPTLLQRGKMRRCC